jgi:hypothetical protein
MPKGKITSGHVRMWPRAVFARGESEKQMLARSLDFLKGPGVYILYRDDVPITLAKLQS